MRRGSLYTSGPEDRGNSILAALARISEMGTEAGEDQ